jgi:hypothetical protein
MSDSTQQTPTPEPNKGSERTRQVRVVGWAAGVSAAFAVVTLSMQPTWPVAFGVAAVEAMVAVVCCCILNKG